MMNLFRGLIIEKGSESLSVGRVAFWAVFILAIVLWAMEKDVSTYQFLTLNFLLLYNLGKKAVWAFVEMRKLLPNGTVGNLAVSQPSSSETETPNS